MMTLTEARLRVTGLLTRASERDWAKYPTFTISKEEVAAVALLGSALLVAERIVSEQSDALKDGLSATRTP